MKVKVVYEAIDGTTHTTMNDCIEHERSINAAHTIPEVFPEGFFMFDYKNEMIEKPTIYDYFKSADKIVIFNINAALDTFFGSIDDYGAPDDNGLWFKDPETGIWNQVVNKINKHCSIMNTGLKEYNEIIGRLLRF